MDEIEPPHAWPPQPLPQRRAEDVSFTKRMVKGLQFQLFQYGALGALAFVAILYIGVQTYWTHQADVQRQQEQSALISSQGAALEDARQTNVGLAQQMVKVVAENTETMRSVREELKNLGGRVERVERAVGPREKAAFDSP